MVTTDDEALWRTMWSFKDHGKSYEAVYERTHPPGFRWLHDSFGTNWRMLEMQAAIGRLQLKKLAGWTMARKRNAEAVWEACREFPSLRVPRLGCQACGDACSGQPACQHAHYKCYVYVRPERLREGWSRDRIVAAINAEGVPCYQGSCPEVYLERAFDNTKWRPLQRLPVARELGETSIMFLVHPTLTTAEVRKTCDVIRKVMSIATNVLTPAVLTSPTSHSHGRPDTR
jgi:dTDP-4-amino-4,6-dideoxygalactose transaminase